MKHIRVTEGLIKQINSLYDEGYKMQHIANELNIAVSTVHKYLPKKHAKHNATPTEIKNKIFNMRNKEGYTPKQIALQLKISCSTVYIYSRF